MDDLQCFLRTHDEVHILLLTETWLSISELDMFNLVGYNAQHSCREGRAGGASIYIKNTIQYDVCEIIGADSPYNLVSIRLVDANINIVVVYRPPRYDLTEFLEMMNKLLTQQERKTLIVGDMNIDILDRTNGSAINYLDTITLAGFTICNGTTSNDATRISNGKSTLIDHVLVNRNIDCRVVPKMYKFSDHIPLSIEIFEKVKIHKPKQISHIDCVNSEKYKLYFSRESSNIIDFNTLKIVMENVKRKCTFKNKIKHHEGNDWVTIDIVNLIKERDKLYKKLLNNKKIYIFDISIEAQFKNIKNRVANEI